MATSTVHPSREGVVPWPDEFAARYTERGYWEGKPLGTHLYAQADATPDAVALVDGEVRLTYRELMERADGAAIRLRDLGLRPDDRIVVQLPNRWEFVVLTLACLRLGMLPVMALPAHRTHEITYLAEHSEARAIAVPDTLRDFDHQAMAAGVRAEIATVEHLLVPGDDIRPGSTDLRALCEPDAGVRAELDRLAPDSRSVAVFLLSGGTTGLPKLIARTHEDHRTDGDIHDLSSLRVLQVGGARLADSVARRVKPVLGCTLQQVFGMAEGLLNYTRLDDPMDITCTTQGRPMSAADEVRVVDELGEPVAGGIPGLLLTRGPYTPRGYYRAEEQNARAFTADGWYRTGDVVRRRPDGYLTVEGRDKDMINRGGEKISAEEIENFAYQLDSVGSAAAVAIPDPELGERVCVYVVLRPGAEVTLEDLRGVMERVGVARFKYPERLVLVDSLLTTKVGKIGKKALRADIEKRLKTGGL